MAVVVVDKQRQHLESSRFNDQHQFDNTANSELHSQQWKRYSLRDPEGLRRRQSPQRRQRPDRRLLVSDSDSDTNSQRTSHYGKPEQRHYQRGAAEQLPDGEAAVLAV